MSVTGKLTIHQQEQSVLFNLTEARNSVQALQMLESFVGEESFLMPKGQIDLDVGALLLSQSVLAKMKMLLRRRGATLGTVFSRVPQTQQAALDEGLFVKEKPPAPLGAPGSLNSTVGDSFRKDLQSFMTSDVTFPQESIDFSSVGGLPPSTPMNRQGDPTVMTSPLGDAKRLDLPMEKNTARSESSVSENIRSDRVNSGIKTLYLRQTLRSGSVVRFEGNVIVIGDVHAGSEVTATGDIMIWGELRGVAHAGSQGQEDAQIRALTIEAIQLRIGDFIARRPDRHDYHKDGSSSAPGPGGGYVQPEVAKIYNGEIQIFKDVIGQ